MIKIIKIEKSQNGFLVNGNLNVPNDPNNMYYCKVQQWIAEGGVVDPEFSLAEIKAKKIAEIKSIRDAKNVESIVDTKAPLLNENGELTGKDTYFTFCTKRHPTNPAADPNSVLTSAIISGQHIPYSTKSPEGVKVTVALTHEIARVLVAHISLRNNNNYKLSDAIEAAVKAATTKEEVEAITWDLKYLD